MTEEWILTATNFRDFLTCEKKYYLNQVAGVIPKARPEYMSIGTLVHEFLDTWHKSSKKEARLALKARTNEVFGRSIDAPNFDSAKLEITEAKILAMAENVPWDIGELASTEIQFMYPSTKYGIHTVKNKYLFAGKVDGIEKDIDGRTLARDYKTSGDISKSADSELMDRDFQASFYFYCLYFGVPIDIQGIRFLYIRRPSIRPKKTENTEEYCKRLHQDYQERPGFYYGEIRTFRDSADTQFFTNLGIICERIDYCFHSNEWMENLNSCNFYGKCPYFAWCSQKLGYEDFYETVAPNSHSELDLGDESNGSLSNEN